MKVRLCSFEISHLNLLNRGSPDTTVGTQKLYKEGICICLCGVYVISYRLPLRFSPLEMDV